MAQVAQERLNESKEDQRHKGDGVEGDPRVSRELVTNEVTAEGDLVQEAERHRNVDVEVNAVPGLIGQSRACRPNRDDGHNDQEPEGDCAAKPARFKHRKGVDLIPHFADGWNRGRAGVGDGGGHCVDRDEPDADEAGESMDARRLVAPQDLINEWRTGHEQDADQGQVGAEECRELADGGEGVPRAIEEREAAVPYPHCGNDQRDAEHSPVEVAGCDGPAPRERRTDGRHLARATGSTGGRHTVHRRCAKGLPSCTRSKPSPYRVRRFKSSWSTPA